MPRSIAALDAWLAVRGTTSGPLFLLPAQQDGQSRTASAARSRIGGLLDAGAGIATVQRLAGQADPATTARDDRRAAHLLHVPFVTPASTE